MFDTATTPATSAENDLSARNWTYQWLIRCAVLAASVTGCVVNPVPTPSNAGGGFGMRDTAMGAAADGGSVTDASARADAGNAWYDAATAADAAGGGGNDAAKGDAQSSDVGLPGDATQTDGGADGLGTDADPDTVGGDAMSDDAMSDDAMNDGGASHDGANMDGGMSSGVDSSMNSGKP